MNDRQIQWYLDKFKKTESSRSPVQQDRLLALSIKQPWLYAITDLDKRVENRTWKPPHWLYGHRIALHASSTMEPPGFEAIYEITKKNVPAHIDLPRGCVVATAILRTCVTINELEDKWFFGPYGWILDDVQKLSEPIPYKGRLGLWAVIPPIARRILDLTIKLEDVESMRLEEHRWRKEYLGEFSEG